MKVQISPKYFSEKLQSPTLEDLVDVYEDRMIGWMFDPAARLLEDPNGGFAALAIILSYFEGVCGFIQGESTNKRSKWHFKDMFLRIFPKSEPDPGMPKTSLPPTYQQKIADKLYTLARCGLYHQGMTRSGIFISSATDCPFCISTNAQTMEIGAILINVKLVHESLRAHFADYIAKLRDPKNGSLRARFRKAWDLSRADEPVVFPSVAPRSQLPPEP